MAIPIKTLLFIDGLKFAKSDHSLFLADSGKICGNWQGYILTSVFQPIFRSNDPDKVFGYDAFVRCTSPTQPPVAPDQLFLNAIDQENIIQLDRLCRTIHLLNFILLDNQDPLLFLNVNEGLINAVDDNHGSSFRKVIDVLGFSPNRIIIELPVSLINQPRQLHFALQNYRLNSLEVAVHIRSTQDLINLTDSSPIHYINIDAAFLKSGTTALDQLNALTTASGNANIILTDNDEKYNLIGTSKLFLQGHAYGKPSALAAKFPISAPNQESTIAKSRLQAG